MSKFFERCRHRLDIPRMDRPHDPIAPPDEADPSSTARAASRWIPAGRRPSHATGFLSAILTAAAAGFLLMVDVPATVAQTPVARPATLPPLDDNLELPSAVLAKRTPGEVHRLTVHKAGVSDVAVSPCGSYLATAGLDKSFRLFRLTTLKPLYEIKSDSSAFHCVTFSHDARQILTGSGRGEPEDRNIRIWDRATGDLKTRVIGREGGTLSIVASADGRSFMTTHPAGLSDLRRLADLRHNFPLVAHDQNKTCWDAAFTSDGRYVVTAGGDGKLFVWDVGEQIRPESRMQAHQDQVLAVAISPDDRYVVTGSADRSVCLWADWKVEDGWRRVQQMAGHKDEVRCVAFSPDGTRIASGSLDRTIRIWNVASGKVERILTGHTDVVAGVAFLRSGRYVVSSSLDSTVRIWLLDSEKGLPDREPDRDEPEVLKIATQGELAVPAAEELAETTALVKEIFKDDYASAKRPSDMTKLAEKMLAQGRAAGKMAPVERYALFSEARRLAIEAGKSALAFKATHDISARFKVDALPLSVETAERLADSVRFTGDRLELAKSALKLAQQGLAIDRYDDAMRLAKVAGAAAKKARNGPLFRRAEDLFVTAKSGQAEWKSYQQALETLASNADDPAANSTAGRYLCFGKADWQAGLGHLAKGADEPLKALAAIDLAGTKDPDDQAALGQQWQQLAADAPEADRPAYLASARYWYTLALPNLGGLQKLKVEKQLKQIGKTPERLERTDR